MCELPLHLNRIIGFYSILYYISINIMGETVQDSGVEIIHEKS